MKLPTFDIICEKEMNNLKSYGYRMLRQYLNTSPTAPRFHWHKRNLLGELYENTIYEKLLKWVCETEEADDFVLKGPYVGQPHFQSNGFTYDHNRQIYYYSDGETIAEFDALFKIGQCQYFVEITDTDNEASIDILKYEIQRKVNLLKLLHSNQVACWLVTTYQKKKLLEGLPVVSVMITPKYNFDFDLNSLPNPTEIKTISPYVSSKLIAVDRLNYRPFKYFEVLDSLQKAVGRMTCDSIRQELPSLISPYIGLVERVFLGTISPSELQTLINSFKPRTDIRQVFLALKIKSTNSMILTIYLKDHTGSLYEIDRARIKANLVPPKKRSTKDIRFLDGRLRRLDIKQAQDYLGFFG